MPVPAQNALLQPKKAEPAAGVAVKVILVPELNVAEQDEPQLIPAGALITEPLPLVSTDKVY